MSCSLPDDLAWTPMLAARQLLADGATALAFAQRDGVWHCEPADRSALQDADAVLLVDETPNPADRTLACPCPVTFYRTRSNGLPCLENQNGRGIDAAFAATARVYLPVLLGAAAARRAGRSFVTGHLTQTLDGRIACENGQSQWIGNSADLRHSHRMRALLDGVLVGATTALRDDPQLTVRHVEGPDPRRIVLSGSGRVLRQGRGLDLMRGSGCEVLVGTAQTSPTPIDTVHVSTLQADDGRLQPAHVLSTLQRRGVHSLYVEGGSNTLSSFLQAGCVDLLQVHVASMLLGSGLPSLQLLPVDHVDNAVRLHMDHVELDGHLLLTCVAERC